MAASPKSPRGRSRSRFRVGKVTVYQRGRSWHVYYRENGATRRVKIGEDRTEAERHAAEVNAQLANGLRSSFGFERIRVEELVPRWLERHEFVMRSSMATIKRYRSAIAHFLRFVRKHHPGLAADRLTNSIAEDFVKHLRMTKISPNGHPKATKRLLRDKGIINVLRTCRALMNYAAKQRHLPPYATNPFTEIGFEKMRIENAKPIVLMADDEEAALLEASDIWEFPIFFTLAFAGVRPGELRHLLIENIDFEARMLHIRNRPDLGWTTKTRNERRIYLFDELFAVLRDAVGNRRTGVAFLRRRFVMGDDTPPLTEIDTAELANEYRRRVDLARAGSPRTSPRELEARATHELWRDMGAIGPNAIRIHFIKLAEQIGRPDLTSPYILRHGLATAMQSADVDPFVRKEIIGHTCLDTTAIYTHTRSLSLARGMMRAADEKRCALKAARRRLTTRDDELQAQMRA